MASSVRWTSADLESLPDDGKRYEIIDGELYVSKQPSWGHQFVCLALGAALYAWSRQSGRGAANLAPGLIFAEDDDVAPDIVWASNERLARVLGADGKLHQAPELVVEVLSPGSANERRDRKTKLGLYSRRGVDEYWIVDWRSRKIEVYRLGKSGMGLAAVLYEPQALTSPPLLPDFALNISELFNGLPKTFEQDGSIDVD
jgi:Uma2 family endonuclease